KGSGYTYFMTICSYRKQHYFDNPVIADIIIQDLICRCNRLNQINLYCYCLMPDHLHLLLSLHSMYKKSLQDWVVDFKRLTTKLIHKNTNDKDQIWQRDFYEHIIRKHESLIQKAKYILDNPVRKGLSKDWESYKYSGFVKPLPMYGRFPESTV
ncbi:MAG: transposase, partial [Candidatus Cloacimonetes bacterium]|nr:transposase [Candidatus Cloacimonadota bacterium]